MKEIKQNNISEMRRNPLTIDIARIGLPMSISNRVRKKGYEKIADLVGITRR